MDVASAHIIASALNNLADHVYWSTSCIGSAIFLSAILRAFFNK